MPRKSQRVGPTTDSEGAQTMAYRACQPFVCAQCRGAILPGSLFSRRAQHVAWAAVGTGTWVPVCMTCRPLRLEGAAEAPPSPSEEQHER